MEDGLIAESPLPASRIARLDPGAEGLSVHPDGQTFALSRVTSESHDIGLARLRRE